MEKFLILALVILMIIASIGVCYYSERSSRSIKEMLLFRAYGIALITIWPCKPIFEDLDRLEMRNWSEVIFSLIPGFGLYLLIIGTILIAGRRSLSKNSAEFF